MVVLISKLHIETMLFNVKFNKLDSPVIFDISLKIILMRSLSLFSVK